MTAKEYQALISTTTKQNKYRNKPCYIDGIRFMSQGEAKRYGELKLLERAGQIKGLQLQVPFIIFGEGKTKIKYVADFVYYEGGLKVVEDFKGKRTAHYKDKAKMMIQGIKNGTIDADEFRESR